MIKGFRVGDTIHLDPRALPDLVVITEEEAKRISEASDKEQKQFVISHIKKR